MEKFIKYHNYSGEEFNKIVNENNLILVKVLNDEEKHNGYQYNEGLNIDTVDLNSKGECKKGGLYFTDYRYLFKFYYRSLCEIIRIIEIPNDAQVYVEDKKYKANKIILGEKFENMRKLYEKCLNNMEKCLEVVKNNGDALGFISESLINKKICLEAVKNNGGALKYVSEKLKDYTICLEAVKNNGDALAFVPEKIKDYNLCLKAVKNNGKALEFVNLMDKKICLEAVKNNGNALEFVLENLMDKEICLEAVKNYNAIKTYSCVLQYVSKNIIDRNICLEAVKNNGHALKYVPENIMDKDICLEAVRKNSYTIQFIPENIIDREICMEAIFYSNKNNFSTEKLFCVARLNRFFLKHFPFKFYINEIPQIYYQAIEGDGRAIEFIPMRDRSYDLCRWALERTVEKSHVFKFSPKEFRKPLLKFLQYKYGNFTMEDVLPKKNQQKAKILMYCQKIFKS
jgi:hypothetical protein